MHKVVANKAHINLTIKCFCLQVTSNSKQFSCLLHYTVKFLQQLSALIQCFLVLPHHYFSFLSLHAARDFSTTVPVPVPSLTPRLSYMSKNTQQDTFQNRRGTSDGVVNRKLPHVAVHEAQSNSIKSNSM
jgi:hypothetical protein